MKRLPFILLVFLVLLTGCGNQAPPIASTAAPAAAPTLSSAITLVSPTFSATPDSALDPTIFGAIAATDIQAKELESVANVIFKKTLDGFVANRSVNEYQVTGITILPGDEGLLAEIVYNVKSSDTAWLADGGTQSPAGLIVGNCSRFDFAITETEFQLKNRRPCG